MLTRINSADGSIAFPFTCVSSQIFPKGEQEFLLLPIKPLFYGMISDINFEVRCQIGRTFRFYFI